MNKEIIKEIEQKMASILNNEQKRKLSEVLTHIFYDVEITKKNTNDVQDTNDYWRAIHSSKENRRVFRKNIKLL